MRSERDGARAGYAESSRLRVVEHLGETRLPPRIRGRIRLNQEVCDRFGDRGRLPRLELDVHGRN